MPLSGKTALVTGGGRGIGKGIVHALAMAGASVALTYNTSRDLAEGVVESIAADGKVAMSVRMAIESRESITRGVKEIRDSLGPISILVNNAAVAQEKPFDTITDADWDRVMAVNLRGAFAGCQEVLPDMVDQNWGRIVNITSIGGQWGGLNQVHYAAAKAGLINFTRSLARIYSSQGITSNAIAPGLVGTEMSAREIESDLGRKKVEGIPIGRIASVNEIAEVVVFLTGDGASYITGQTINVNGGMYFG